MKRTRWLIVATSLGAALLCSVSALAQSEGGRPFSTTLSGTAEVPGPGDPDGTGEAAITLNQGRMLICYQISVAGIEPATVAHIHEGLVTEAGPIIVPLNAPTNGFSSGCASVDPDEIKEIRQQPDLYYINVHNAEFPGGAVRGQLSK
jgi:hypothetical protein